MTWTSENTLYLDMDGVFADFDLSAEVLCGGMRPYQFEEKYGSTKFWETINSDPNFFINLKMMPEAMDLFNAVKHLEPVFLTGCHKGFDAHANQKRDWIKVHFGHQQRIICCQSSKKSLYIKALGDVLVDDRQRYMRKWIDKGGYFVLHKNPHDSIMKLKNLGLPL